MKNYIDPHIPKVAYLQLYEHLRQDIMDGVFAYGTKLPSKRLLAEETGVSVITVEHAYAILADEGYIEARPRSGYFAIYRAGEPLLQNGSITEQGSHDELIALKGKYYQLYTGVFELE